MKLDNEKLTHDAEQIATAIMNAVDSYIKHCKTVDADTNDDYSKQVAKDSLKQYAVEEIKTAMVTTLLPYTIGTGLPNDGSEELPRD